MSDEYYEDDGSFWDEFQAMAFEDIQPEEIDMGFIDFDAEPTTSTESTASSTDSPIEAKRVIDGQRSSPSSSDTSSNSDSPVELPHTRRRSTNFHLINIYNIQILSLMNSLARASTDDEMADIFNKVQDLQFRILEERSVTPEIVRLSRLSNTLQKQKKELEATEEEFRRTNALLSRRQSERKSRFG